jgi:hypothetical protein
MLEIVRLADARAGRAQRVLSITIMNKGDYSETSESRRTSDDFGAV